jgi:hypothetical protein
MMMELPRRKHLAAGAAALPAVSHGARAHLLFQRLPEGQLTQSHA